MVGNSSPVLRFALLFVLAAFGHARADACPPAVVLEGDAGAIETVGEILGARGISLAPSHCAIHATIAARGDEIAIEVRQADGTVIERSAQDAGTAATVIESFTRSDGDPLLESRPVPASPRPTIEMAMTAQPPARSPRGVRLSTAFESSFGSDHTRWSGMHLGACIMLGPICAGARLRAAGVTHDPWTDDIERQSIELLAGIDVPFALGRWTFMPGFAAGLGQMHTRVGDRHTETGGVRADVHATLSIPLWRRLALDLFAAADLTQETRGAWNDEMMLTEPVDIPDEPRLLLRFGLGLSYGGL